MVVRKIDDVDFLIYGYAVDDYYHDSYDFFRKEHKSWNMFTVEYVNSDYGKFPKYPVLAIRLAWAQAVKTVLRSYDAGEIDLYSKEFLDAMEQDLRGRFPLLHKSTIRHWRSFRDFIEDLAKCQLAVDFMDVAIACELYRMEYAVYPKKLGELVPEFLDREPSNRTFGGEVRYKLGPKFRPVIYSCDEEGEYFDGVPNLYTSNLVWRYNFPECYTEKDYERTREE